VRSFGQRHRRQHAVGAAGQALQDGHGVGLVLRLADDLAVDLHGGVGGQHRVGDQVALADAPHPGPGLGQRHAHDVILRALVRQHGLVDIRVLARHAAEHQQLEAHADLRQQFAAARAAGGEIDPGLQADHGLPIPDGRGGSSTGWRRDTAPRPAAPAPGHAAGSGWTGAGSRPRGP
jgi:hypothetical protein